MISRAQLINMRCVLYLQVEIPNHHGIGRYQGCPKAREVRRLDLVVLRHPISFLEQNEERVREPEDDDHQDKQENSDIGDDLKQHAHQECERFEHSEICIAPRYEQPLHSSRRRT